MKTFFTVTTLLLMTMAVFSQLATYQTYRLVSGDNVIAAKNYYLLTSLQHNKNTREIMANDSVLSTLLSRKRKNIIRSLKDCTDSLDCFTGNLIFSEEEIINVGDRLSALCVPGSILYRIVVEQLFPSGTYILFNTLPPKAFVVKAWEQDARGINFAINVYARGAKPHYPFIDSIAFDTKSKSYPGFLHNALYTIYNESSNSKVFFVPSLTAALTFLELNERNNAGDYEPMTAGENKAAAKKIKTVKWADYKYSLIMIPGAGPEEPSVALSAEGILRCRLAALQYRAGLAPFIVTSGGKVHPYKTKYCEAIEMKRYLFENLHIPPNAILIDPHARHTTTNMRNTVRLIYRYGIPVKKAALTCTTRGQSSLIEATLPARCLRELHEVPYKNGLRLNESTLEFYPLPEALQINPEEPMDP